MYVVDMVWEDYRVPPVFNQPARKGLGIPSTQCNYVMDATPTSSFGLRVGWVIGCPCKVLVARPPAWVEIAVGLPATLIFTLALLPFIKGAVMGAIWVSKPELAHKV